MALATNLGFPRIGPDRELKKAVEACWAGRTDQAALLETAAGLRAASRADQRDAGLDHVPCADFSFYDTVLDTACMAGAVPERYGWDGDTVDLDTYFAMARGDKESGVTAMEMTKWFDTNYHYIVPEFEPGMKFSLSDRRVIEQFKEAKADNVDARPVVLGPVSFLLLGKAKDENVDVLGLLPDLLPVWDEVFKGLRDAGAEWVQVDEPCLVLDLDEAARGAFKSAYADLSNAAPGLKMLLTTYFGDLRDNLSTALELPVEGLHVDLVRAPDQLDAVLADLPDTMHLSVGVVDGRNIWRTDLERALGMVRKAENAVGSDRLMIAPSCSLLHSPVDLDLETDLDEELKQWLAFARQKVREVAVLTRAINDGEDAVADELAANRAAMEARRASTRIHNDAVKERTGAVGDDMMRRGSPYTERRAAQSERLGLPAYPTTTIGSFPQTAEVRRNRALHRKGEMDRDAYVKFCREEIERTVRKQEDMGLDVLVHGECERNDMVEYFGEQLAGFAHTRNGWVVSYGSRCVKPPVIFGDVHRPEPMTVEWIRHAASCTDKPMKGMLTGPVTILQWSFVRDDQPRSATCRQIALAIRDEVADLEEAGIGVIQIDEPALREGLPLRRADWDDYLEWGVNCFRLASSGVDDATQIHTHMCYSEFNDIIRAIAALDADVISMEASRSDMDLLEAFDDFDYPNEIGPGVYDIHSPRVPDADEMETLARMALDKIDPEQLWINPDCGLKTRKWEEVEPSLRNMVEAARRLRG